MTFFKLDRQGVGQILKSAGVRAALHALADPMAGEVAQSTGLDTETGDRTTDRAVVDVTIAHPAGIGTQAKTGALTRAAMSSGLEVRAR